MVILPSINTQKAKRPLKAFFGRTRCNAIGCNTDTLTYY